MMGIITNSLPNQARDNKQTACPDSFLTDAPGLHCPTRRVWVRDRSRQQIWGETDDKHDKAACSGGYPLCQQKKKNRARKSCVANYGSSPRQLKTKKRGEREGEVGGWGRLDCD